jgi:hypothetical protein
MVNQDVAIMATELREREKKRLLQSPTNAENTKA